MAEESPTPRNFDRYRGFLLILAEAAVGPKWHRRFDAADIVQETLLQAYRMRAQLRGTTNAEEVAWLKTMLRRVIEHAMRDHTRDRRDLDREVPLEVALERSSVRLQRLVPASASTPSGRLVRIERELQVSAWLLDLPETQRQAVVMKYLWELSIDETAERMGKAPVAVMALLKRGLKTLRERASRDDTSSGRP